MSMVLEKEEKEREKAEIAYGHEECYRRSMDLMEEMGFPRGVMPLKNIEECGFVEETGFVWMKLKEPYEHFFEATGMRVLYDTEITGYIEKLKMKKITGVRSKQMFLSVPIVEMAIVDEASGKIIFKTSLGIGKSFPVTAFL